MRALLFFALLVAACRNGERPTEPPPADAAPLPATTATASVGREDCAKDDDCVLTTFAGVCSCCPCAPLHAVPKAQDIMDKTMPALAECARLCEREKPDACAPCRDPAKEGMHARCHKPGPQEPARCILVEASTPR